MSSNGSGEHEKVFWGELLKHDLQNEIKSVGSKLETVSQQVIQIKNDVANKLTWKDVVGGVVISVGLFAGYGAWLLSQSKDAAQKEAVVAIQPTRQECAEAKMEAKASKSQTVEAQKELRLLSKQIATKQVPPQFEKPPRIIKAEPVPGVDGGP